MVFWVRTGFFLFKWPEKQCWNRCFFSFHHYTICTKIKWWPFVFNSMDTYINNRPRIQTIVIYFLWFNWMHIIASICITHRVANFNHWFVVLCLSIVKFNFSLFIFTRLTLLLTAYKRQILCYNFVFHCRHLWDGDFFLSFFATKLRFNLQGCQLNFGRILTNGLGFFWLFFKKN